jgi:hypothetical protein
LVLADDLRFESGLTTSRAFDFERAQVTLDLLS